MANPNTKFLVVDDFSTMRRIVRNLLKELGYSNVDEAEDGAMGLSKLKTGDYEFVVSDWNMPKMTGLEFLKQVRASSEWAQLPFVLLTSESERDQVTEAILAGVSQYVVKPFAAKIFEEKLKGVWAKHNAK